MFGFTDPNGKTTRYLTAVNIAIVVLVGVVCVTTASAVPLLGLFFVRDLPLFQPQPYALHDDDEDGSEYGSRKVGFINEDDDEEDEK